MAELVPRVKHLCYLDGVKPKVSCLIDPTQVQAGKSYASEHGITAKPLSNNFIADGTPYTGHNGEDTVSYGDNTVVALSIPKCYVKLVGYNDIRGHWLEYGNERVTVRQCHFDSLWVRLGSELTGGDTIGWEGSTGKVTGKHLHTSIIIDGKYVDPRYYVTGELSFPADIEPIKRETYPDTDPYEYVLKYPRTMQVDTKNGKGLNVRQRPQTIYPIQFTLSEKSVVVIDKRADFPDGQIWGRLKDKPWHWTCIYDPYAHADSGEWYLLDYNK